MKQTYTRNKPKIRPAKLTLAFMAFHRDNPQIYKLFVKFASEVARNRSRFGSRAILERIRWETATNSNHETLKIPNAYSAYYSRLFEMDYPRFDGMFQHNTSIANELYDLKITRNKDAQLTFSFYN
jgi:hypothetical protein